MKPIFVTQPYLPPLEEFLPYLQKIWDSKTLTNGGPMHKQLEAELCDYLDVEHISLFTNGTLALVTALQALRIHGEVITTPYSFVAGAHSLLWNGIEPVFVTLSQAARLIEEAGYTVEYLPFHAYLGAEVNRWNQHLAAELSEMVRFYDPRVIAFDGNTPYSGLLKAMQGSERAWSVWIRRGFWRAGSGAAALERESAFDAVIEPEDLADVVDRGPTTKQRSRTLRVPPIRLLDEAELLPRDAARRELDLAADRLCVLIQLGAGNNFDFGAIQERVLSRLATQPNCTVALLDSPIALGGAPEEGLFRVLRHFPSSRLLHAFDCVVSAVGYNSFHELVLSGTPSLLVPNEHPMMDDQRARAEHGERMGWSLTARTAEIYRLGEKLERLLDPEERSAMRHAMADLRLRNGAEDAARILAEMTLTARADRQR